MSASLVRGATAGAVGTLALGGFALLRNAALGHAPPYAARRIASRLMGRTLHRTLRPSIALAGGLGLAWARLREALPTARLPRGLLLGAGVWALEHLTFPMLRATAPARTWTLAEHSFLLAQALLFGLVTERCLAALEGLAAERAVRAVAQPASRTGAL
jgi:hypothetical protein